jgi:hypothetical protein
MKLKIISDGTFNNTKIINIETGEEIKNISYVRFTHKAGSPPKAIVQIEFMPAELTLDMEIKKAKKIDKN